MAIAIGFFPLFIVILVIAIILGFITKKWSKVAYTLSGVFFLIGIIYAFNIETISDIQSPIICFGLGFLISSINGIFKKK